MKISWRSIGTVSWKGISTVSWKASCGRKNNCTKCKARCKELMKLMTDTRTGIGFSLEETGNMEGPARHGLEMSTFQLN